MIGNKIVGGEIIKFENVKEKEDSDKESIIEWIEEDTFEEVDNFWYAGLEEYIYDQNLKAYKLKHIHVEWKQLLLDLVKKHKKN